jgi:hypothetical protein
VSGGTITAIKKVEAKSGAIIAITEDATLTLASGIGIDVVSGATLDVKGNVVVDGGVVEVAGTIIAPALNPAGLPTGNAISFANGGTVVLKEEAIGYYGTTPFIGPSGSTEYAYNWDTNSATDSSVTLKAGNVTELTKGPVTVAANTGIAADTKIVIATAEGATASSPHAKLTVPSGKTFIVAGILEAPGEGGFVVENGGTLQIDSEGEVIENVSNTYGLNDTDAVGSDNVAVHATSANLNAEAVKTRTVSLTTVKVTLTPKESPSTPVTWLDNFNVTGQADNKLWGGKVSGAPAWQWTDISVKVSDLFSDISNEILSVRSTNHAYRYYRGAPNIWAVAPTVPTIGDPNIYIPATDDYTTLPVKWRIYAVNKFASLATWGIILGSGVDTKEIVVEIHKHTSIPSGSGTSTGTSTSLPADLATDGGTLIRKLVVDYSKVSPPEPPAP